MSHIQLTDCFSRMPWFYWLRIAMAMSPLGNNTASLNGNIAPRERLIYLCWLSFLMRAFPGHPTRWSGPLENVFKHSSSSWIPRLLEKSSGAVSRS